jgi:alpha,alpha-trehalase
MVDKTNMTQRLLRKILGRQGDFDQQQVTAALEYIEEHWKVLTHQQHSDQNTTIGLPHAYVAPAAAPKANFTFNEQYYWDSYFTALGLVGRHQKLAEGMLENLLYLFRRFGFVPNASRMYFMGHSQPPLLTSYIRLIYDTGGKNKTWLAERMALAQAEYEKVWTSDTHPFWHRVHKGLSRYYDVNVLHDLAEVESGWDMTTRFERKCLDYIPIDLNSLLYKYETDLAWAAQEMGKETEHKMWLARAAKRKRQMHKNMWNSRKGFFFDYNYIRQEQGDTWSLAGFYPMWAGLATKEQAAAMVRNLERFRHEGGLSATSRPLVDMGIFGSLKAQWAFPNGWAPLHHIVIEGLKNYGYNDEASEVARAWLRTNLYWFEEHGEFLEKYNVVKPHKHSLEGVYPNQRGFGWTNAIFIALSREYLQDIVK